MENNKQGNWFPSQRFSNDHAITKVPGAVLLLDHLSRKAAYKNCVKQFNGVNIELTPGDCMTGRISLSKETGFSQKQIRTILSHLENHNIIEKTGAMSGAMRITKRYTVYSIVFMRKFYESESKKNKEKGHVEGHTLTSKQDIYIKSLTTDTKKTTTKEKGNLERRSRSFFGNPVQYPEEITKRDMWRYSKAMKVKQYKRRGYIIKTLRKLDDPQSVLDVLKKYREDILRCWQSRIVVRNNILSIKSNTDNTFSVDKFEGKKLFEESMKVLIK